VQLENTSIDEEEEGEVQRRKEEHIQDRQRSTSQVLRRGVEFQVFEPDVTTERTDTTGEEADKRLFTSDLARS
jgi:hypothetical protein